MLLQKWSWDGLTLATCAQSIFSLELILLTIHILCSVTLGAMECVLGGYLVRTFDEKYHRIHDSVCTSDILMVGLITGTFNEQD